MAGREFQRDGAMKLKERFPNDLRFRFGIFGSFSLDNGIKELCFAILDSCILQYLTVVYFAVSDSYILRYQAVIFCGIRHWHGLTSALLHQTPFHTDILWMNMSPNGEGGTGGFSQSACADEPHLRGLMEYFLKTQRRHVS